MPTYNLKVKPNKKKTEILKITENNIIMNVKAPPENNKANIEIIKFLSKYFNKKIKIIKGQNSKNKIISF